MSCRSRRFHPSADALMLRIQASLAGLGPELQGAVIADLTAMWVAGHRCGDPAEERQMHQQLIDLHANHVRELVAMYVEARG